MHEIGSIATPSTVDLVQQFITSYGLADTGAGLIGDISNHVGAGQFGLLLIGKAIGYWKSSGATKQRQTTLLEFLDATLQHVGLPKDERESALRLMQTNSDARNSLFRADTAEEFKAAILDIARNPINLSGDNGKKLLEVFTNFRFQEGGQSALNILRDELNAIPNEILAPLKTELHNGFQQQLATITATLNAQKSTATLREPLEKWEPTSALSRILKANTGVTDLIGRDVLMQELIDWCDIMHPKYTEHTLAKLIHAPGGMGKTRIGVELCLHLNQNAWRTGFVNTTSSNTDQVTALLESNADLLIVLDYPEGHASVLKIWIESIASQREARAAKGLTTRLLMLARTDDWMDTPRMALSEGTDFLDPDSALLSVQKLEALEANSTRTELQTRQALYDHVRARYAAVLEPTSWKRTNPNPAPTPDFAQAVYSRPLMLNVQAVLDCTDTPNTTGPASIEKLLDKLMEHEHKYWTQILNIPTQTAETFTQALERTVARVVLGMTPHNEDETLALLRHEPDWHTTDPTILRPYAIALK